MDDKLLVMLENLGAEGIDAFYVYLVLDYGSLWILIGLFIWGARTVWAQIKQDGRRQQ